MVYSAISRAPGILPSPTWLQSHGYSALCQRMYKYPEAFAHITQRKLADVGHSVEYWIEVANQLAESNNGKLPPNKVLVSTCPRLMATIYKYPGRFAHIPQERLRQKQHYRSLSEYVEIAEQLCAQYGGIPYCRWLYSHGFGSLYQSMQDNKDAFAQFIHRGVVPT